jgi:hypothetical protein
MTRARDIADQQENLGGAVPPFAAGKNRIINGDCNINQRNFSSQTLTTESGIFIVDRISGVNVISGSSTFSVQQFALGTAPVAGYEAKQYIRAVTTGQDSGFAGTIFGQAIEDVRTFANQTVTVSFWAKAASGTPNVSIEFRQVFGTGGSPSDTVEGAGGVQKFAISTSWTRYSKTITLPSIAGKTLGTNGNSRLETNIWVSAGAGFNARTSSLGIQSNTFDIWGFQVEAGSVATPFQTASGSIGGELALCQRYFAKSYAQSVAPGTANGDGIPAFFQATSVANNTPYGFLQFPMTMRTAPTITCYSYNGTVTVASRVNDGVDLSANTAAATTTNQFGSWVRNLNASTFTSSQGAMFHYTASAEY